MGGTTEADPIWTVWRGVTRILPVRNIVRDTFLAPSAWGMFGVDYIWGLRRNRSTQAVIDLVAPLSAHDLRRLHALALVNHRRHEAVSRWVAIGALTLPVSAALALSELAPSLLADLRRAEDRTGWTVLIVYVLVAVGFYLAAAWRARQIAAVVELALIERGVLAEGEHELEPPLEPPLGA